MAKPITLPCSLARTGNYSSIYKPSYVVRISGYLKPGSCTGKENRHSNKANDSTLQIMHHESNGRQEFLTSLPRMGSGDQASTKELKNYEGTTSVVLTNIFAVH